MDVLLRDLPGKGHMAEPQLAHLLAEPGLF
jgi:hypothetical protein